MVIAWQKNRQPLAESHRSNNSINSDEDNMVSPTKRRHSSAERRMKSLLAANPRFRRRTSSLEDRMEKLPVKISFNNLNYFVNIKAKDGIPAHKQQILKDCSGYIAPG